MKTLIWVTGFPRSGTTWMQGSLLGHSRVDGSVEESPLGVLWGLLLESRLSGGIGSGLSGSMDCSAYCRSLREWECVLGEGGARCARLSWSVYLAGLLSWKLVGSGGVSSLDGIAVSGRRKWGGEVSHIVFKAPGMDWFCDFPGDYVDESSVWCDWRTVVMKRDCGSTWGSCCRQFGWGGVNGRGMSEVEFRERWDRYYSGVCLGDGSHVRVVEHGDCLKDSRKVLGELGEWLGLRGGGVLEPCVPFVCAGGV